MLIGSCIRQKPDVLKKFLKSVYELEEGCLGIDHYFITDNLCDESKKILGERPAKVADMSSNMDYSNHEWSPDLVNHVTAMKNTIIDFARDEGYDYLFLSDSDNELHPELLKHLISRKKDIIGEICWTRWKPEEQELPNAWLFDQYGFKPETLERMRNEELLEVGGFGGCVLMSKKALEAGINYDRLDNLHPEWGEDRFFAVRASVLGFKLWLDTKYPMNHMYRHGKPKVLIAIPHTGNIRSELVSALLKVLKKSVLENEIELGVDLSYGMPVDSNRNSIVKKFLVTDYEWLLMIDSDIVPPLNVLDLLKHEKKVVGAVCFTMSSEGIPYPVIMRKDNEKGWGYNVDRRVKDLMNVDVTGASCLLIHRSVLEKIPSPFRLGYDKEGIVTVIGEDFDFCEKVRKIGLKVWVDTTIQCGHYKAVDLRNMNNIIRDVNKNG